MNTDKTEEIWFGSRASIDKLSVRDRTLTISETTINTTDVIRNLGIVIDSQPSMKQHVAKVASVCFYHIRRLRQIRRHVDGSGAKPGHTSLQTVNLRHPCLQMSLVQSAGMLYSII